MSFPVASGSGSTAAAAKSNAVAPMFGGSSAKGKNASNGNEEATAYELPWLVLSLSLVELKLSANFLNV